MVFPVIAALLALGLSVILLLSDQFTRSAREEVLSSLQQALYQAAENLNDRMEAIDSVSALLAYDSRLQTAIGRRNSTLADQIKDITELREMLEPVLIRKDIVGVRVYLPQEQFLSREGMYFYSMEDAKKLPEYGQILTLGAGGIWIGAREVQSLQFKQRVLSFARSVRDPNRFEDVSAMVLIDIPLERLDSVLSSLSMAQGEGRLFLLDGKGGLALAAGDKPVEEEFLQAAAGFEGKDPAQILTRDMDRAPYVFMRVGLSQGGWQLVAALPESGLLEKHGMIGNVLPMIVLAVLLLLTGCIAILLVAVYTRSIKRQIRQMNVELADSGMIGAYGQPSRQDIFHLRAGMSQLVDTARMLIDDAYQAQVREREAAFRVLQAQINPHFLYNTLDTIYWMAAREKAADAARLIKTLADYFRVSLSSGRDIITLEEEVRMVRAYLTIQAERYDHEFRVEWDVSDEALSCLLPKLTLQPLVENALLHGLRKRPEESGALLRIQASVSSGWLSMRVMDNGPGFTREARASFSRPQSGASHPEGGGYGLNNVRERLRLFSGGRFELVLEDRQPGFTTLAVRLELHGPSK